jgi:hypothetical protein
MEEEGMPAGAGKVMESIREAIRKLTEDRKTEVPRAKQTAACVGDSVRLAPKKPRSKPKNGQ